jgi:hypothetical protein
MASDELMALPAEALWDGEPPSREGTYARNGLRRAGISTVGQLTRTAATALVDCRNYFGAKSLAEVRRVLAARGLALKGDPRPGGSRLRDARGLPYEVVTDGACVVIAADAGLRLGLREREEFEVAYKQALAEVRDGQ